MAAHGGRAAGFGGRGVARMLCAVLVAGAACAVLATAGALPVLGSAYAELSVRLEERFRTQAPGPPARLTLGPQERDVRLAGAIGPGTAGRLAALLAAHPAVRRIHLTSEGGLVEEAVAIGDLIAARGLATYVPDYCVSACTLAFVRGTDRALVAEGRLGFHAPYDPGLFGQVVQADASAERAAYLAAGLDPAFVARALAVASDDLWIPEPARLIQARVATELVDTDRFPDSTLDDDPSPAGARAAVLRALPLLDGLAGRGGVLDALAAAYLDGYRAGLSEGAALDRLRAQAGRAVARVLQGADDAAWVEIGRVLLRAMRGADPEACRAIGGTGDLLAAGEILADGAAAAVLARAAGPGARAAAPPTEPIPIAEPAPVAQDLPITHDCAGLIAAYGRALARPGAGAAPPAEPIPVAQDFPVAQDSPVAHDCAGLIAAYGRALARPGAGAALRALASHRIRPAREAAVLPR